MAGRLGGLAREFREAVPPEVKMDVADLNRREVRDLGRDPDVLAVTIPMPTRLVEPVGMPAAAGATWGIGAVGADLSAFTGKGVVVAVLDTGIDHTHPAFAGVDLMEQDFSGSGNGDQQGHGTHCAGTIFGRDVGGTRIGVARGVGKALIGKVLTTTGGSSEMLFSGLLWALQNGANVISMSLGFDFPGMVDFLVKNHGYDIRPATSQALEAYRANLRMFDSIMGIRQSFEAFAPGSVVVAAAGNESKRPQYDISVSLPAAAEDVISVGALRLSDTSPGAYAVGSFSNTMPEVVAPGVNVTSAKAGGGLTSLTGTSMACPHVAGVAALWWEAVQATGTVTKAGSIIGKVTAMARSNVFDPGTDMGDVGRGLVTAP
ncbi:S8 family peptidase [Solidesulfovibrio sp.]